MRLVVSEQSDAHPILPTSYFSQGRPVMNIILRSISIFLHNPTAADSIEANCRHIHTASITAFDLCFKWVIPAKQRDAFQMWFPHDGFSSETFWSSVARDTDRTYAVGTPSGDPRKR